MNYCKVIIWFFLIYAPILIISLPSWGISRIILYINLIKSNKISTIFPGHKYPQSLGGKNFLKFEKMIFNKDKILTEDKRKIFFLAYWSGFAFYAGIVIMFLVIIICILS